MQSLGGYHYCCFFCSKVNEFNDLQTAAGVQCKGSFFRLLFLLLSQLQFALRFNGPLTPLNIPFFLQQQFCDISQRSCHDIAC